MRNLTLDTFRIAGRADIAHAPRDLHDRVDAFAVHGIQQTMIKPGIKQQRRGRGAERAGRWVRKCPKK
ncbi:hypothetical protein [Actinoplanes regularis]|uniref:hypothetical protein n=1 Tax=Actinoplanes regularis TaxID=52697 RepID=UPI0025533435|nr:hypothetical protein [Actinoplanes regularis]